jgi:hypothetical protein
MQGTRFELEFNIKNVFVSPVEINGAQGTGFEYQIIRN